METESMAEKAEAVRRYFAGRSMLVAEHGSPLHHDAPDAPGTVRRAEQRERHYRYMLRDREGATEIRITEDAMQGGTVEELGRLAVSGRHRKALGEAGDVWIEMVDGGPTLSIDG